MAFAQHKDETVHARVVVPHPAGKGDGDLLKPETAMADTQATPGLKLKQATTVSNRGRLRCTPL